VDVWARYHPDESQQQQQPQQQDEQQHNHINIMGKKGQGQGGGGGSRVVSSLTIELTMAQEAHALYGSPEKVYVTIDFPSALREPASSAEINAELRWIGTFPKPGGVRKRKTLFSRCSTSSSNDLKQSCSVIFSCNFLTYETRDQFAQTGSGQAQTGKLDSVSCCQRQALWRCCKLND